MAMNYTDRGDSSKKYFTEEDNEKIIILLREWIPLRKAAITNGTTLPQAPEFVGKAIMEIVNNTSRRHNYAGYWFREDMVGDAVVNILRYLHTFDVNHVGKKGKINFFAWVTMCLDRSFSRKIIQEEDQKYFRMKMFSNMGGFDVLGQDDEVLVQGFVESTGIAMDFQTRMGAHEEKREVARKREREKNQLLREQERIAKMPKGIARFMGISKTQLQEDFGDSAEIEFEDIFDNEEE